MTGSKHRDSGAEGNPHAWSIARLCNRLVPIPLIVVFEHLKPVGDDGVQGRLWATHSADAPLKRNPDQLPINEDRDVRDFLSN